MGVEFCIEHIHLWMKTLLYTEKEAVAIYISSVQELFKKFAKLMSDYLSSQKSFTAAETGK